MIHSSADALRGWDAGHDTHASTADPDAMFYRTGSMLYRKRSGMEAKLSYIGHGLMENRSGLLVDDRLTRVSGNAERLAARR